jgi:hypothetical protein
MFHHRIKDLLILNAVLAIVLASAIALNSFVAVAFIAFVTAVTIVLPVVLIESYLYRRKRGWWYLWRHPAAPRPRYKPSNYPIPYPRVLPFEAEGESLSSRNRTQLFQSGDRAEPVSRVSILLKVAGQLEASGRTGAATRVYQQVIESAADTPESREAVHRLHLLTERNTRVGSTLSQH